MTAWLAIPAAIVAFVVYHWLLGPVLDDFRRDLRGGRRGGNRRRNSNGPRRRR